MLLLSREDIKKVFTIKDAIEADKKAFQLVVEGKCEAPLRTNIQAPKYEGCFLFMPAYVEEMDTASLKIINIFPHNIDQGIPSSPAQVLLIDGTTGLVTAVLDGTYVTSFVPARLPARPLTCWPRRTAGSEPLSGLADRLLPSWRP